MSHGVLRLPWARRRGRDVPPCDLTAGRLLQQRLRREEGSNEPTNWTTGDRFGQHNSARALSAQIFSLSDQLRELETNLNAQYVANVGARLDRVEKVMNSFDQRPNPGLPVLHNQYSRLFQLSTVVGSITILLLIAVAIVVLVA